MDVLKAQLTRLPWDMVGQQEDTARVQLRLGDYSSSIDQLCSLVRRRKNVGRGGSPNGIFTYPSISSRPLPDTAETGRWRCEVLVLQESRTETREFGFPNQNKYDKPIKACQGSP